MIFSRTALTDRGRSTSASTGVLGLGAAFFIGAAGFFAGYFTIGTFWGAGGYGGVYVYGSKTYFSLESGSAEQQSALAIL